MWKPVECLSHLCETNEARWSLEISAPKVKKKRDKKKKQLSMFIKWCCFWDETGNADISQMKFFVQCILWDNEWFTFSVARIISTMMLRSLSFPRKFTTKMLNEGNRKRMSELHCFVKKFQRNNIKILDCKIPGDFQSCEITFISDGLRGRERDYCREFISTFLSLLLLFSVSRTPRSINQRLELFKIENWMDHVAIDSNNNIDKKKQDEAELFIIDVKSSMQ